MPDPCLRDQQLQVAQMALDYLLPQLKSSTVLGIGSGSTVNAFISRLGQHAHLFAGAIAASRATEQELGQHRIKAFDLNTVEPPLFYVDSADEYDRHCHLIKGGGGALTREKIIAQASKEFILIATQNKSQLVLGRGAPLPIEVIPMARGLVARRIVALGGTPTWRKSYTTDNGNIILDACGLKIKDPKKMEQTINDIPGVVCNGIFALRRPDVIFTRGEKKSYVMYNSARAYDNINNKLPCAPRE